MTKTSKKTTIFLTISKTSIFFEKQVEYFVFSSLACLAQGLPTFPKSTNHENTRIQAFTGLPFSGIRGTTENVSNHKRRHSMHNECARPFALVTVAPWLLHQVVNHNVHGSIHVGSAFQNCLSHARIGATNGVTLVHV